MENLQSKRGFLPEKKEETPSSFLEKLRKDIRKKVFFTVILSLLAGSEIKAQQSDTLQIKTDLTHFYFKPTESSFSFHKLSKAERKAERKKQRKERQKELGEKAREVILHHVGRWYLVPKLQRKAKGKH